MFARLAVRDLVVIAVCIGCWELYALVQGSSLLLRLPLALVVAVTSFLANYVGHEWGHLLGAKLAGSVCHPANRLAAFHLFHFDTRLNDTRQFLAMAAGGLIASTLLLAGWIALLPLHDLSGIATLTLIVLGYIATLITELPVVWRIAHGAALPQGAMFEPTT